MTKKSLNKLLSVILTLAICSATVFGCLITANADSVVCYEWSEGSVSENLTSATIDLTFTAPSNLPEGIVVGRFNLNADENLVLNTIAVTGGVRVDGADFSANDFLYEDGNTVSVDEGGEYLFEPTSPYSSVTLTLTFGFSGGAAVSGTDYAVNIGDVFELTGPRGDSQYIDNGTGNSGLFKTGCDHVFDVTGLKPAQTNAAEGYHVYKNVPCKNRDVVNPYQVVPATELKSTVYWDGSRKKPTTQVGDTYIINTAEELAWIVGQTNASATSGKNYKVADGIGTIILQNSKNIDAAKLMACADGAETRKYFDSISRDKWVTNKNTVFAGNFDGNGVEIYGEYGEWDDAAQGIFGMVAQGVTLKNFAVKNSYLYKASGKAGAIFGGVNATANGTVTIENVIVSGCYLWAGEPNDNYGIMVGSTASVIKTGLTVKNCLVHSNTFYYAEDINKKCGIVGTMSDIDPETPSGKTEIEEEELGADNQFENCIILDCAPYSVFDNNNKPLKALNYKNMYTNGIDPNDKKTWPCLIRNNIWDYTWNNYADKIISINRSDVKGNSAVISALNEANESTVWYADPNGGYPSLVTGSNSTSQNISTTTQYNLNLKAANIDYNENDGSFNFNFYYEPTAEGLTPVLYVGQADVSGFHKLTGTVITQEMIDATQAYLDAGLVDGTLRYTIKNISAREIGDTLLPTAVAKIGSSTVYGKSEQISVADYATKLINDANVANADKLVAASLINYGNASKAALETAAPSVTKKILHWDGTNKNEPTTQVGDTYIINTAEELAWIVGQTDASATRGKNYKVADDISAFILLPESIGVTAEGIMACTTAAETKAYLDSKPSRNNYPWVTKTGTVFAGNFDGNGVEIYGEYGYFDKGGQGIFGMVAQGVTLKNFAVKNSFIYKTDNYMGAVFGGVTSADNGTVTLENVIVSGCYFWVNNNGDSRYNYGIMVGNSVGNHKIGLTVKNCLVYNNTYQNDGDATQKCGIVGRLNSDINQAGETTYGANNQFENCIILDTVPYSLAAGQYQPLLAENFKNVYTNAADPGDSTTMPALVRDNKYSYTWNNYAGKIISIDKANLMGGAAKTTCPNLDWTDSWVIGVRNSYPAPVQSGAKLSVTKKILHWDGTNKNEPTTQVGDTYIINTAEELAWIVGQTDASLTSGKNYKVADGIGTIILQNSKNIDAAKLMACADAAETKAYFDSISRDKWVTNKNTVFAGNFDGNGVEIYGEYGYYGTGGDQGIFGMVAQGVTLKNFAVKNSYLLQAQKTVGAVFGGVTANDNGTVTIENVIVSGCYISAWKDASNSNDNHGIMVGSTASGKFIGLTVKNCLVYNNTYNYPDDTTKKCGIVGQLHSGINQAGETEYGADNQFENCIILDTVPYSLAEGQYQSLLTNNFKNVYTNGIDLNDQTTWPCLVRENKYDYTWNTYDGKIFSIDKANVLGNSAETTCPNLDWFNVWGTDSNGGYPYFRQAGIMSAAYQSRYDSLTFENYNSYTGSTDQFGLYATSLNLKNNPYISLIFAFGYENGIDYKADRVNIQVAVTGASGTLLYNDTVPEYKPGEYISNNKGWTNKKNAGKFHTLKLDNISLYDLSQPIKVKIQYGEKIIENTVSVSGFGNELFNSYKKNPCDYYLNCAEATKALLFYTQSLKARYGA